ncbi:hypothetical protein CROQUDRAFT_652428 [Cronartium quercuum f. sp. fusiforme G11]|uniref:Glycoside hydrolase family 71 protein n=1 Tax=Cronartium quercuum f. sp. fusiforme G11 TaxID=708437 RepID=A0A9P6NNP5_9BASI|nr:hypothetical protein CROQUDRAFT_652428 [Cronartium quercuum f. sp. fusiforme G11]
MRCLIWMSGLMIVASVSTASFKLHFNLNKKNILDNTDNNKHNNKRSELDTKLLIKDDKIDPILSKSKSSKPNYVFAHFVQGNAQNYTKEDWMADMITAREAHIDAFAINIGNDTTNAIQLPMIYDVADSIDFKVFLSFDMTYFGYKGSAIDIQKIVIEFANRTSQFKYNNKVFVSTFSGEVPGTYLNNNTNYPAAWCALKASLRGNGVHIYFLPGWTGIKPSVTRCTDGLLSWDAWPPHSATVNIETKGGPDNITLQEDLYFPDKAYIESARAIGKSYAAPVSPLFFKHLTDDPQGNYVHRSDDWMMINRYTKLIKQNPKPEFIELLTWNDYGESHYLRDPQPSANLPMGLVSAHEYVDGFPHTPLLNLLAYFNQWYKNGKPPVLNQTTVYVWYRPHIRNAIATQDPLPVPAYSNLTEDRIYAYVIPGENTNVNSIRILSGYQVLEQTLFPLNDTSSLKSDELCQIYEDPSNNNELEIDGEGILLSAPFEPGTQLVELLDHQGIILGSLQGLEIEVEPLTYNFNYWSGSLTV